MDCVFGFLWKLQNLNRLSGWVFENLGLLFWNKYSAESFGHWETLRILENMICKRHIYIPTLWTQDVSWTYIRRSEDVQDVFWTSCDVQFTSCVYWDTYHEYNENLELLAELHIFTFYFDIFHSAWLFCSFLHFCFFFQILVIKSEFRYFI